MEVVFGLWCFFLWLACCNLLFFCVKKGLPGLPVFVYDMLKYGGVLNIPQKEGFMKT